MKEEEKVRQITKNEARKIDPSKVAYFTLSDGTVFIVKENMKQENQNVPQEQEQIQTTSQNEQINIPAYSQNTQEIQQQENNIGYNISSEGENIQQNSCCKSRLISAQYIGQNTYIQQGPRRQFYKLIQAIPVRFCDIQGVQFMNQNTNSQIYLQRYNNGTYIVDRSSKDNLSNYQVNTQTSGINKFCSCGGRIENVETKKKNREEELQREYIKNQMLNRLNNLYIEKQYLSLSNNANNIQPLMSSIHAQIYPGRGDELTKHDKIYIKSNKPLGSERDINNIDYSINERDYQRTELRRLKGIKNIKYRPKSTTKKRRLRLSRYNINDPDIAIFKKVEMLNKIENEDEININDNKFINNSKEQFIMDNDLNKLEEIKKSTRFFTT